MSGMGCLAETTVFLCQHSCYLLLKDFVIPTNNKFQSFLNRLIGSLSLYHQFALQTSMNQWLLNNHMQSKQLPWGQTLVFCQYLTEVLTALILGVFFVNTNRWIDMIFINHKNFVGTQHHFLTFQKTISQILIFLIFGCCESNFCVCILHGNHFLKFYLVRFYKYHVFVYFKDFKWLFVCLDVFCGAWNSFPSTSGLWENIFQFQRLKAFALLLLLFVWMGNSALGNMLLYVEF